MGHEVAVVSGHQYPYVNGSGFPANYVAGSIQYTWQEGQSPNSLFTTRELCQVSSPEVENNLLQTVSRAHSRERSEMSINISTVSLFNDLENFDSAQFYGSTDMSTTPSMTTHSIEEISVSEELFEKRVDINKMANVAVVAQ